jgi:cellulose synthase (UDP-forming)
VPLIKIETDRLFGAVSFLGISQNALVIIRLEKKQAMALSQANSHHLKSLERRFFRPRVATLVLLLMIAIAGAVCAAWFAGEGTIQYIFERLNQIQELPPFWLEAPKVARRYLLVPTIFLLLVALVLMRVSPQPRGMPRLIVVGILLLLTVRYVLWRSLTTLNLANPTDGVFSLGLFFLEMLMLASSTIQLVLMLRVRDRHREANQNAIAVAEGVFTPSVDVLIPTYNEPAFILRRTVIGCQAMDYENKRVYLLDDTHRAEIRALAEELGCDYLTRTDNHYAKAGNLNHALGRTNSELIVVFDADFVPTRNFLLRTVGFFQARSVALVQTPQSFYNPDPIARNLGLENVLTPEEEVFYRQIQPIRDAAGSVICSGTSFVVRRSALEATGGFVTDSLSEDYFTGIRLSASGYQLVYLDEKLSAGLAAENMTAQATQRLRWARGTLQAFFIDTNPLTIPGLTLLQRLAHLEGLLHWFTSISRVGYLMIPLAYSFLNVIPVKTTEAELLYFFLPYYVVQLSVFSWLNSRSRSALLSDIYSLVLSIPLAFTVIKVMLNPFSKGFQVTPKGTSSDRYSFNWSLGGPLIGLFVLTAISLWRNLGLCMIKAGWANASSDSVEALLRAESIKGINLGWLWSGYNLMMLGIALLILLDVPRADPYNWLDLQRTVRLTEANPVRQTIERFSREQSGKRNRRWMNQSEHSAARLPGGTTSLIEKRDRSCRSTSPVYFSGTTTMISEGGAEVLLAQPDFFQRAMDEAIEVNLEFLEEDLTVRGQAVCTSTSEQLPTVRVQFAPMSLTAQRKLIEMLFCRPGQWQRQNSPSEFQSLLLLFRILLKPRVLFDQQGKVRAIAVTKS